MNTAERNRPIDVALAFDESYLVHACVVMSSILANNDEKGGRIRFWLFHSCSSNALAHPWLEGLKDRVEINFIESPLPSNLPASPWATYMSDATYIRLSIPDLLPADVTRILYLDSDMLCMGPLAQLFDVDLNGRTVAAVRDARCRRMIDDGVLPGLMGSESDHIDHQAPYFNAGMLLIDTDRWREARISEIALQFLARNHDSPRYLDQDALNYALYGRWLRVAREWNFMLHWRLEPQHGGDPGSATIVHSTGSKKFWSDDWSSRHLPDSVFRSMYFEYRRQVDAA